MGLTVNLAETDIGIPISNAYIGISKNMCGIVTSETYGNQFRICGSYNVYASKQARIEGKNFISSHMIETTVAKDNFGNIFTHLYGALKQQYPDGVDEL